MLIVAIVLYLVLAYVIFMTCLLVIARLLFSKSDHDDEPAECVAHKVRRLNYRMTGRAPTGRVTLAGTKFYEYKATS